MDCIDLKCGNCQTIFSLKLKVFAERYIDEPRNFEEKLKRHVFCPSCQSKLPEKLWDIVYSLAFETTDYKNWEIGLRFISNHSRIDK